MQFHDQARLLRKPVSLDGPIHARFRPFEVKVPHDLWYDLRHLQYRNMFS